MKRNSLVYISKIYSDRNDIVGVEVGTGVGLNALDFIDGFKFSSLLLVEIKEDLKPELERISSKYPFVLLILRPSVEAATMCSDNSIDFVYIDADHSLKGVREDINAWWPKLKKGGWMLFHDYNDDVRIAVDEFANSRRLKLYSCWSETQTEAYFQKSV